MAFSNNIQSTNNFNRLLTISNGTENPLTSSGTLRSIDERLGEFFADGRPGPFTDADLAQVSFLLQNSNRDSYSRVPRLYTVLRIIDQLEVLDKFIEHNITDLSFPFNATNFPSVISVEIQDKFMQYQPAVLTKALDLEKGEQGGHLHFGRGESVPYEVIGKLGSGAYGEVEKVVSLLSHREFARKKVRRTRHLRKNESGIKAFLAELRVLKRISHNHCVKMNPQVGSYTNHKHLAFIMSPVADSNLASYMEDAVDSVDKQSLLRTFFGCLCNGLQYLHQCKIRHRDVKPANILVKGTNVLWADFGISLDWADMSRSTTNTDFAGSLLYCAPEVANFKPRNSSSDIWSLGCVFLEMTTILKGQTVTQMRQSFTACSENYRFYTNTSSVNLWIENLHNIGSDQDNYPLKWIKLMLNVDPRRRPTAQILFSMITNQCANSDVSFRHTMFCGSCCIEDDESSFYSESDGEYWIEGSEEQRILNPYPLPLNLDSTLAQVDQYSTELASNFHQDQDPGHGSSDAMSNSTFPSCDNSDRVWLSSSMDIDRDVQAEIVPHKSNFTFPGCDDNDNDNDGDDDNDGSKFLSLGNSVCHPDSTITVPHLNCVFPDCDNDQGKGFSDLTSMKRHIRSIHLGQKPNCTFPSCGNRGGKGFRYPCLLWDHILSVHLVQKVTCTWPGCDDNKGEGFSSSSHMKHHVQSVHLGQKSDCTFPGCGNKNGMGFSNSACMKRHFQSVHLGQKSDCTFPGCDNKKGRGFPSSTSLKRHFRSMHLGPKSDCTFLGCNNNFEKGFPTANSLKHHIRIVHSSQESNFTSLNCGSNRGDESAGG